MNYVLVLIIFCLGVGFHIMQKIITLRVKFHEFGFSQIFGTFFKEEWDSLMVSALVLSALELALFITDVTHKILPSWVTNWGMWVLPLVLGYAGQRIAYKWLGTAAEELEKKAEEIK